MTRKWVTLEELAEELNYSLQTLKMYHYDEKIPFTKYVSGTVYVDRARALEGWDESVPLSSFWMTKAERYTNPLYQRGNINPLERYGSTMTPNDAGEWWGLESEYVASQIRRGYLKAEKDGRSYIIDTEYVTKKWKPAVLKNTEREKGKVLDEDGHPKPGRALGAGNTPKRLTKHRQDIYLKTMHEIATEEEWRDICRQAVLDAKDGDHRARSWLSDYLIGKPLQRVYTKATVETTQKLELGERAAIVAALLGVDTNEVGPEILDGEVVELESDGEETS